MTTIGESAQSLNMINKQTDRLMRINDKECFYKK